MQCLIAKGALSCFEACDIVLYCTNSCKHWQVMLEHKAMLASDAQVHVLLHIIALSIAWLLSLTLDVF